MTAIGFKDHHAPGVMSGDKPFTLRRTWKRPERMPNIDQRVDIVTGWRTPARRVVGTARVAFRCRVEFSSFEIMGLEGWRAAPMAAPMAEKVHDLLIQAADGHPFMSGARPMREFARLDGFDSYEAFWAFHDRHRARRADTRSMWRELIGFDRVVEEFAS